MIKRILMILIGLAALVAAGLVIYNLPPVHDRLAYRLDELKSRIQDIVAPPQKAVFVPQNQVLEIVRQTIAAWTPTANPTSPTPTQPVDPGNSTPTITALPTETPPPTAVPTPIPAQALLKGIKHEYQKWNNCGPTNLSMELSFWKWQGDQTDTAAYLKPNSRDKNVMPYEMASYVADKTTFKAVVRLGGDLNLLKTLIAAGFPVIVEKGFEGPNFDGWMGHYEVVNGYDDATSRFTVQDSYIQPDLGIPYADMQSNWRAFDFIYIVVFPPERQNDVLSILGPQADEHANYLYMAQKAQAETQSLMGRDQYFAWYNLGTSLVDLQNYSGAAAAYDEAYKIYPSIPENKRPYRMEWYQTGPYFAYFNTGRLQDVIDLATKTLASTTEPALEESWVWRARAKADLGDTAGAIDDFRTALKWHPGFQPALDGLKALGASS
jgi:tetratricopeptide (TPR) repeat protein